MKTYQATASVLIAMFLGLAGTRAAGHPDQAAGRGATNVMPQEILLWPTWSAGRPRHGRGGPSPRSRWYPANRRASRTGVVVAPGGGYSNLASDHEGRQVAAWFNAMGVSAFVLKYRIGPRYHHPIEMGDALRALRLVAIAGGGLRHRRRSHWDDGVFGRRSPRIDGRYGDSTAARPSALGSDRPRQQPAGLPDPRLPRHLLRSGDRSRGIGSESARRTS